VEPTVGTYVVQLLHLAESAIRSILHPVPASPRVRVVAGRHASGTNGHRPTTGGVRAAVRPAPASAAKVIGAASRRVQQAADLVDDLELGALVAAAELANTIDSVLDWIGPSGETVVRLVDGLVDALEDRLTTELEETEQGLRALELVDLAITAVRGLVRDGVIGHPAGFSALDHFDLRDWFQLHGARDVTLDGGLLRGIYDLVFAYRDGDPSRPSFAAGQGLRGMFRMFFDYRGSFAYRMQAGMGDVVFAPYYEALRARGVRFRFFHRVTDLAPSDDGRMIDAVQLECQATVRGDADYEPLREVLGLPSWPAEPDWSQLESPVPATDGPPPDLESDWNQPDPAGHVELRRGVHFDHVVFGLSLGSVPSVCSRLLAQKRAWRRMVDRVATVQTQALQIWLTKSTAELSGDWGAPVVAGYVEPFDTWADMSHLVHREVWPSGAQPESIHYFCNAMVGPPAAPPRGTSTFPDDQREIVRRHARDFLDRDLDQFLPDATYAYPQEFRWELLAADSAETGPHRLATQYFRANVAPSERYVQSLPGTDRFRISPGGTGYENLALAGDWTDSGFNAGCVEAATMSGLLAAKAVIGTPDTTDVIGHGHP
jgi:uncharacterized protein with NAD-binding domain and iron-sulfur cluster